MHEQLIFFRIWPSLCVLLNWKRSQELCVRNNNFCKWKGFLRVFFFFWMNLAIAWNCLDSEIISNIFIIILLLYAIHITPLLRDILIASQLRNKPQNYVQSHRGKKCSKNFLSSWSEWKTIYFWSHCVALPLFFSSFFLWPLLAAKK